MVTPDAASNNEFSVKRKIQLSKKENVARLMAKDSAINFE